MKKKDFLNDVMHEINMLKQLATKEELAKLNFETFISTSAESCIYGQMTGNCQTSRAKDLMDASCIRVMNLRDGVTELLSKTWKVVKLNNLINGENTGQGWNGNGDRVYRHVSALEGYIAFKGAKNEAILQYLRGERETLKL